MVRPSYPEILAASLVGLGILISRPALSSAQGPEIPPMGGVQTDGIEVQARGPIHEAFAEPVDGAPPASRIVARQPPAPIEEMPTSQAPQGDVQWISGYWAWDDDRNDFLWVSGLWRQAPPGRQWLPGNWVQADAGWQWVAGFWSPAETKQLSYLPPPPAPLDAPPSTPAPSAVSIFVPGNWYFNQLRYVWRPGYWLDPRPGWVWIPAHFVWTPVGYIYVEGHWDFEPRRRGLLFAPVYFTRPVYARAGWVYRPYFAIQPDFVLGALFVRRGYPSYYFGDYFGGNYPRGGFVPFFDYRLSRYGYDPLFNYYRWAHRDVPHWESDFRGLYVARANGTALRPPRTLTQQTTLAQSVSVNKVKTVQVAGVNLVSPLASLTQIRQAGTIKLQTVSAPRMAEERAQAKQLDRLSVQRAQSELALRGKGFPSAPGTATPHTVRLDVPVGRSVPQGQIKVAAPPLPAGHKTFDAIQPAPGPKPVTGPRPPGSGVSVTPFTGTTTKDLKPPLPPTGSKSGSTNTNTNTKSTNPPLREVPKTGAAGSRDERQEKIDKK